MQRLSSLPIGTKLVLVATTALFLNLSLTWQRVDVDFGPSGSAELLLDGWDAWGLLVGMLALGLLVLTVLLQLTDVELPENVPWRGVTFALATAVLVATIVKVLTDAGSTVVSYVGIALAAAVVVGESLDVRQTRAERASSAARA